MTWQRAIEFLWPKAETGIRRTWAILDGARSPEIRRFLDRTYRDWYPLLGSDVTPALAAVGPVALLLPENDQLSRELLAAAWGNSWGIFIRSRQQRPDRLISKLADTLWVKNEDFKRFVFRYFDPRVINRVLPTCDDGQLDHFFEEIDEYIAEDREGRALKCFSRYWSSEAGKAEFKIDTVDLTGGVKNCSAL